MDNRPSDAEAAAPPANSSREVDPGLLTWTELAQAVRRNLWIILSASAGLAVLALLTMLLIRPPRYESVATLVIAGPPLGSDVARPALAVEEYRSLLESNAVLAATAKRLRALGVLEEDEMLRIGKELRSQIVVSPRAEETALAPVIEAVAESSTPESAATVANTWSEVFLEKVGQIQEHNRSAKRSALKRLEEKYQEERARLVDLIEAKSRLTDEYRARLDELAMTWDRRQVEAKKTTEALILEQNLETRRVLEELAGEAGVPLTVGISGEKASGGWSLRSPEAVEGKILQVLLLRTRLAQTPRYVLVHKVVSEDMLSRSEVVEQSESFDLQLLVDRRLIEQESNPIYEQLTLQLARTEADLGSFSSQELRWIHRIASDLHRLQSERTKELTTVMLDRALVMANLERQRSRCVQSLQEKGRLELDQVNAEIAAQREIVRDLAENDSLAGASRVEQEQPRVRLAEPASPPSASRPRNLGLMTLVGAFVGGLLGFVISVLREMNLRESRPLTGSEVVS